jgi:WG containing repeat
LFGILVETILCQSVSLKKFRAIILKIIHLCQDKGLDRYALVFYTSKTLSEIFMRGNKKYFILTLVVILFALLASAETKVGSHKCVLPSQDFKEVDNCIKVSNNGQLFIVPQYLRQLSFGVNGLADIYSEEEGWMYVDRKGRVIISGVAEMDNGADVFHDGLVRFSKNNKWGFADVDGKVVVSAIYDGAMNFENGLAKVCNGCRSECAESNCEHHVFTGGEWSYINTQGEIVKESTTKEGNYEKRRTN